MPIHTRGRQTKSESLTRSIRAARIDAARTSRFRSASSALVSRLDFARALDLTFYGQRNITEALGYTQDSALTPAAYRQRYNRCGIASRLVRLFPESTWGEGATVYEDPEPDNVTDFEEQLSTLFSRLDFWSRVTRADILTGLGRYGALLIGAPGDLSSDLISKRQIRTSDDILGLTPLGEERCKIESRVKDKSSPRFGLAETYKVKLFDSDTESFNSFDNLNDLSTPQIVHWSRIIHIAEGCLESDLYGEPRLRSVWNYLTDLDKVVGGGAEAAWKRADPGINLDINPEIEMGEEEEEALSEEVEEYEHGLSRFIRTRGGKINVLSAAVTMFGANADSIIQLISASKGIPFRILAGSERGELASTQDRNNWADRVSERREKFANPLIRHIVDRFIAIGALLAPTEYHISWPEIEELDEGAKAEVAGKIALANKNQVEAGGELIQTSDEIRESVWGLEPSQVATNNEMTGRAREAREAREIEATGKLLDLPLRKVLHLVS